jgi:hypothetical protein
MAILPIDSTTFLLILLFTFLFDMIDLKPQTNSFRVVFSMDFWMYFIIRIIFGSLAAVLLLPTGLFTNVALLAFVSVLASVTTLTNFNLKVGGENVANIATLLNNYRQKMIEDQSKRASNKTIARQVKLACDLADNLTEEDLEKQAFACLVAIYKLENEKLKETETEPEAENEKQKAQKTLSDIDKIAGQDKSMKKALLAQEIVDTNPDYAEQLLSRHKPKSPDKPV